MDFTRALPESPKQLLRMGLHWYPSRCPDRQERQDCRERSPSLDRSREAHQRMPRLRVLLSLFICSVSLKMLILQSILVFTFLYSLPIPFARACYLNHQLLTDVSLFLNEDILHNLLQDMSKLRSMKIRRYVKSTNFTKQRTQPYASCFAI